jgi:tetratricopeptide (TPR) repeat protein
MPKDTKLPILYLIFLFLTIIATYYFTSNQYSIQIASLRNNLNKSEEFVLKLTKAYGETLLGTIADTEASKFYSNTLNVTDYNLKSNNCLSARQKWADANTHYQNAIDLYQQIKTLNPKYSEYIENRIEFYKLNILWNQNMTEACKNFEKAYSFYSAYDYSNGNFYIDLGNSYVRNTLPLSEQINSLTREAVDLISKIQ